MTNSILFRTSDPFGEITVEQDAGARLLRFGTRHRQASMLESDPVALQLRYTHALAMSLLFNPEPKRALIIGLGGGSLVKFLLRHAPTCHIDAVELRPEVVKVAHRFFFLPEREPRLRVHVEDGAVFVQRQAQRGARQYDLIVVDAFDAEGPVAFINHPDFLRACRHLITLSGVVAVSDWIRSDDGYGERRRARAQLFDYQALTLALGREHSNVVNFLFRRPIAMMSMQQILIRATQVQRRFGFHCIGYLNDIARQNFVGGRSQPLPAARGVG